MFQLSYERSVAGFYLIRYYLDFVLFRYTASIFIRNHLEFFYSTTILTVRRHTLVTQTIQDIIVLTNLICTLKVTKFEFSLCVIRSKEN
jgi:hypothetical protein